MSESKRRTSNKTKSKGYSSKAKKPNSSKDQEEGSGSETNAGYRKTRGSNDLAWHSPDAELLKRASQIPWSFQTGELVSLNSPMVGSSLDVFQNIDAAQPGIMIIRDQLSVGGAGYATPTSRIMNANLPTYNAAQTLMSEMRSRAKIRNTYDAPDVFMLMMAMANIYTGIILAKRLAGTVRMFTYKNNYLPEALIAAQGFDPAWFKTNQYRFVTELNVLISEVNKVYIPNRMHLFELINERFSNYYTEGEDIKDQIYVITPAFLNILDTQGSSNWASQIKPYMCMPGKILNYGTSGQAGVTQYDANNYYTGDQLLLALRRMLENVLIEGSTADITGDMSNCFGDSDRFYLPMADPMAICSPVFDEEILETIHNMSWSLAVNVAFTNFYNQGSVETEHFKIVQDPTDNRIGSYDCFELTNTGNNKAVLQTEASHRIVDVHRDPSPEKTFAITRLRNITADRTLSSDNTKIYTRIIFSTDLICMVEYVTYIRNSGGVLTTTRIPIQMLVDPASVTSVLQQNQMNAFHYRPLQITVDGSTGKPRDYQWPTGETDIWAQIDATMINNSNMVSLLTLLGAYNNLK